MSMGLQHRAKLGLIVLFGVTLMLSAAACSAEPAGPRSWIDFPRDQAIVPAGTAVPVQSHAYAAEGVGEVLLSVNGMPYRRIPPSPGGTFVKASHDWFPEREGDYALQIIAYGKDGGASSPASIRVRVQGKATSKPDVTPTPVVTLTPTPTGTVTPPTPVGQPDLEIVSVEAIVAGYKGDTPLCDIRLVYRNSGTAIVPRDYVLQAHLNGRPLSSQTRGAGFPPGGVSEATFRYQFVDTAYIGINLDSTDAVTESNETNNAFAEARLCSGTARPATPTATATATIALPVVISRTPTPTPTRTPTIGLPVPAAQVDFRADAATIDKGKCTLLRWDVENATGVSLDGSGVEGHGTRQVCPDATTPYTLRVSAASGDVVRTITISVRTVNTPTPTRTRTPTVKPDTDGPPAPGIVGPKGSQSCRSSVTLDWNAVSDPSGIKQYYVKWARSGGPSGGTTTTGTQHTLSVQCGYSYSWSVRAEDKAGNVGDWADGNFSIQAVY